MKWLTGLAASLCLVAVAGAAVAVQRGSQPERDRAARAVTWWDDIKAISSDETEGRLPGSRGYMRAADYVISRFKAEGLTPAGDKGSYLQAVEFEQQSIDYDGSSAALIRANGSTEPLKAGEDLLISSGGAPRPRTAEAPLVFIGYGLHLPEQGHDDLKGVDLKGKIAVVISGGPGELPGPMKSSNRSDRAKFLSRAGAVGVISLTTHKQIEIPWARQKVLARQSGMYLADAALRETPDGFFTASIDPDRAEQLFTGSGHSFASLSALADASRPVPGFALPVRIKATVASQRQRLSSPNLVAKLEGSDARLKNEYVVLSAHLDHLGVGAPVNGDAIFNGAMDDASGVASVLDMARRLKAGPRTRRSFLFVIVTAEEKGLLGSHYFAHRPTVPKAAVVADLNLDMPLPLWPLKTVLVQGEAESTLGAAARAVAAQQGLALVPDPLPDRNSFTRTDQYSFVKAGIPSLAFKFGFARGTPEFQIENQWRANRYHSVTDDVDQPGVLKEEAIKLDDYIAGLAARVANDPARPRWLETSVFRRFAER